MIWKLFTTQGVFVSACMCVWSKDLEAHDKLNQFMRYKNGSDPIMTWDNLIVTIIKNKNKDREGVFVFSIWAWRLSSQMRLSFRGAVWFLSSQSGDQCVRAFPSVVSDNDTSVHDYKALKGKARNIASDERQLRSISYLINTLSVRLNANWTRESFCPICSKVLRWLHPSKMARKYLVFYCLIYFMLICKYFFIHQCYQNVFACFKV